MNTFENKIKLNNTKILNKKNKDILKEIINEEKENKVQEDTVFNDTEEIKTFSHEEEYKIRNWKSFNFKWNIVGLYFPVGLFSLMLFRNIPILMIIPTILIFIGYISIFLILPIVAIVSIIKNIKNKKLIYKDENNKLMFITSTVTSILWFLSILIVIISVYVFTHKIINSNSLSINNVNRKEMAKLLLIEMKKSILPELLAGLSMVLLSWISSMIYVYKYLKQRRKK